MSLILTNDDGIDAPGLQALIQALGDRSAVVAAPKIEWSGCGHRVTTHQPIHVEQRSPQEYAIAGTPADCTRVALSHLCPQATCVVAGINAGGNMGVDVYLSGTVAAVREAAFHGIPGIAISQYRKGKRPVDWQRTSQVAAAVLADLLEQLPDPGRFWNVNLPYLEADDPLPEVVFCEASVDALPVAYRIEGDQFFYSAKYGDRPRTAGTDVDVCFSGHVAVTQLGL